MPPSDAPAPVAVVTENAATAAGEAAVEIARIEAERDTTIAETHAETERAAIEARAEAEAEEDVAWLRGELGELRGRLESCETQLTALQQLSNSTAEQQATMATMMAELSTRTTLSASEPEPAKPEQPEPPPTEKPEAEPGDGSPAKPDASPADPPRRKRRYLA